MKQKPWGLSTYSALPRCLLAAFVTLAPAACSAALPHPSQAALRRTTMTARSVDGRRIEATAIGSGDNAVLLIGGIHGNEASSVRLVGRFKRWALRRWRPPPGCRLIVLPDANPDGHAHGTRKNARHVDLNRNFPARDWGTRPRRKGDNPGPRPASEPETRFIVKLIKRFRPRLIVSVHAPYHQVNIDGPAMRFARDMHRFDHDRITHSVGYPTPGSLGRYAGRDGHIPVITLELARKSAHAIWNAERPALLAAIDDACGGHALPKRSQGHGLHARAR